MTSTTTILLVIIVLLMAELWRQHQSIQQLRSELKEAWDYCAEADAEIWHRTMKEQQRKTRQHVQQIQIAAAARRAGLHDEQHTETNTTSTPND